MQRVFIKVMLTKLLGSFASEDVDVIGNIVMAVAIPVPMVNSISQTKQLHFLMDFTYQIPLLLVDILILDILIEISIRQVNTIIDKGAII